MSVVEVIVLGSIVGGIWALVASGFSLVFGVARVLNFAHGTYFALGAYFAFVLYTVLSNVVPSTAALLIASAVACLMVGFVGVAIYTFTVKPVRNYEIMVILVTLAVALLIKEILLSVFSDVSISVPTFVSGFISIAGIPVTYTRILAFVLSISIIAVLDYFVNRTKLGKEIIATSQDCEAAMLVGINVERVFTVTMFLSALLAGIGGILYAQIYAVNPMTALRVLIYAFAIVILGGLGSVRGSIVAAFIVGYMEVAVSTLFASEWAEVVAMLTIIAILIARPRGIMGEG
ncbi:MAG: branched-chain amino acid ABC transporter permease [Archaeoglobus sp.]|jgi:branched-chain amino acid transport system permease protein|nr:MAG: branched-chain amino acid ABC transporter permease [Archaeoglobus sp.]